MSEALYVLGTGNAAALNCYNTCFSISDGAEYIQVDAGGGNGILRALRDAGIPLERIHHLIVTHEHTDHVLGVVWMVRMIGNAMRRGRYEGDFCIYAHGALIAKMRTLCSLVLQPKDCAPIDRSIRFVEVHDGELCDLGGYPVTFFDIHSTKARQFGFTMTLHSGRRLTCLGDEPYHPACRRYAENADWLLHEAFCLYGERDVFQPYEKHHSTVRDAARNAHALNAGNLVLWHTEDSDLPHRRERYCREAGQCFDGQVYVPADGEVLLL